MNSPEPGRAKSATPKMAKITDKSVTDRLAARHEQTDSRHMLTKNYNDEKLAITLLINGAGMIAYYFGRPAKYSKHNTNHVETPS